MWLTKLKHKAKLHRTDIFDQMDMWVNLH